MQDNLSKLTGVETEIIRADEITFSFVGETLQEHLSWLAKSRGAAPVAWKIKIKDSAGRDWHRTIPFMVRFNEK